MSCETLVFFIFSVNGHRQVPRQLSFNSGEEQDQFESLSHSWAQGPVNLAVQQRTEPCVGLFNIKLSNSEYPISDYLISGYQLYPISDIGLCCNGLSDTLGDCDVHGVGYSLDNCDAQGFHNRLDDCDLRVYDGFDDCETCDVNHPPPSPSPPPRTLL